MQCGPVQIIPPITVPPSPTPNPVPSCIDMTGTPCPPGQEWTYTYPPGIVECHPVAVVPPLCPKPVGGCPSGSDWWNDPTTGIWHCTPNGEPIPKPTPKPVASCESLIEKMRLNLSVECADLPKELRSQLEKCGYLICAEPKIQDLGDDKIDAPLWAYLEPIEEALIREQF